MLGATRDYNLALARFYGRALLLTVISPFVSSAREQELINEHWNKLRPAQDALAAVENRIYGMVGYSGPPSNPSSDEGYMALVAKSHKEEYRERLGRISFSMHPAIVAKRGRFELQLPKWARDELKNMHCTYSE